MKRSGFLVVPTLLAAVIGPVTAGRAPARILDPGAQLERVATGYDFTEGPAVDAAGNVFFSDAPKNRIVVLPAEGQAYVWKAGTRGANGMLFDRQGRLVTCNSQLAPDGRTVTRFEPDGSVTVLADRYQGRRFNSPNDLAIDGDGRIYFTDPRYGPTSDLEQDRMAVYRIEKNGDVTRVIDDVQVPNGIVLSPDGRRLYVADNSPNPDGNRTLVQYEVRSNGRVRRLGVLHDFAPDRGIDGMAVDERGRIYATAGSGEKSGVYVFAPDGRLLEFIRTPETATNCTFGGRNLRLLYVTAGKSLYRIRTTTPGRLVFPRAGQRPGKDDLALLDLGLRVLEHTPRTVVSARSAGGYAAFPDVTRNADGDLLCAFYSGYGHVSPPKDGWDWGGRIMLTRSRDEGRTWEAPVTIADTPHDDRDPHIARMKDGSLVLTWFVTWDPKEPPPNERHPHAVMFSTSVDGRFWTAPRRIGANEERWWACSAPVRELKDGTWILGLYTMDRTTNHHWGGTVTSRDHGRTWSRVAPIGEKSGLPLDAETDVVELKDGRLLAALRSSRVNLHFAWSSDRGASWSAPADSGFPGHAPCFLRLRSGEIILGHRLPGTSLHWSRDDGRSWNGPVRLDEKIGAYPGFAELPNGDFYAVWYEEGQDSGIRGQRLRLRGNRVEAVAGR